MPACCCHMGRILIAVLLWSVVAGRGSAQDLKQLDQRIYDVLKEVINTGADVYNAKAEDRDVYLREMNRAGCYRIYQGSLLTVHPLLAHRPQLQKVIDNSIAKASTQASMAEKAFSLREALDEIRRVLKPGVEDKTVAGTTPSDAGSTSGSGKTLWDRLGGEAKVSTIVDQWLTRVRADSKVDFSRGNRFKLTDLELQNMKISFVQYISGVTKGPLAFKGGRSMAAVHKGMGITSFEFTAMLEDLKQVLIANNISQADSIELLQTLETTRKDIVEVKTTNSNTSDGFTKPAEKGKN
jgi:hemoglobin